MATRPDPPTLAEKMPPSIAEVVEKHVTAVATEYEQDTMTDVARALGISRKHLYRLMGGWRRKAHRDAP